MTSDDRRGGYGWHGIACLEGYSQMTDTDDEALKAEIDEIMNRVDAIMDNVARVLPTDSQEFDGQEKRQSAP
jgi:hypothetical protein